MTAAALKIGIFIFLSLTIADSIYRTTAVGAEIGRSGGKANFEVTCPDGTVLDNPKIELYHLQQMTRPFGSDIPFLRKFFRPVIETLQTTLPGSRFGFGQFIDKPIPKFGEPMDYCHNNSIPLTEDTMGIFDLVQNLKKEELTLGGDLKMGQLEAMARAASVAGFTEGEVDPLDGRPIFRVMSIWTYSHYHEAGDVPSLPPFDPTVEDCALTDYPSIQQTAEMLRKYQIRPLFLQRDNYLLENYSRLAAQFEEQGVLSVAQELRFDNIAESMLKAIHLAICRSTSSNTAITETSTPVVPVSSPAESGEMSTGVIVGAAMGGLAALGALAALGGYAYVASSFSPSPENDRPEAEDCPETADVELELEASDIVLH